MKKIKSQKGITMISLMLYVASFAAIMVVVGGITTFFYSNMQIMDVSIESNTAYSKFNLYLLSECKKPGATIFAMKEDYGTPDESDDIKDLRNLQNGALERHNFVTIKSDTGINSFIYDELNKDLYYNSIKLCQDVETFQMKLDKSTGKDVLSVLININGTAFQTKYVVGS